MGMKSHVNKLNEVEIRVTFKEVSLETKAGVKFMRDRLKCWIVWIDEEGRQESREENANKLKKKVNCK